MVIKRINLRGMEVDAAGAVLVAGVALLTYIVALHGPLMEILAGDKTAAARDQAVQQVVSLQQQCATAYHRIEEANNALATRAQWVSDAAGTDEILTRISELADQCKLRINRWEPKGADERPDYRAQGFIVEGQGHWIGLYHWLSLVEAGIPFLDITHFQITTSQQEQPGNCTFSCTLRLYSGSAGAKVELVSAKP